MHHPVHHFRHVHHAIAAQEAAAAAGEDAAAEEQEQEAADAVEAALWAQVEAAPAVKWHEPFFASLRSPARLVACEAQLV